ncbi:hypothetical protein PINS_up012873 [Pythium insidiosum]|nr:hypothetical protein PINS_up012873 [Pythium insidiosum]
MDFVGPRTPAPEQGLHPLAVVVGVVILLAADRDRRCVVLPAREAAVHGAQAAAQEARPLVCRRRQAKYVLPQRVSPRDGAFATDGQRPWASCADDGVAPAGGLPGFAQTAAESGNARVIKRWVNSTDRDVDARSHENLTALHYAARAGHNECVRLLLAASADPNVQDERRITPLHLAAIGGHALCVKLLLDHHADPFREDLDQHTALTLAESSGNIGCARLLQRAMAKATVSDDVSGRDASLTLRAGSTRVENAV